MSGDTGTVTATHEGALCILTFENPPEGYMDAGTERELAARLDEIEADPEIRVVVLTGGQEGVFIRHYDTRLLEHQARALQARGLTFDTSRHVPEPELHRCFARIEASEKIWIAAINGTAMGGGYELALACDLRLAQAGDYPIGLPEVRVGLLPGAGGTQRLADLVGRGKALEYILFGSTFDPEAAAAKGLVSACTPGAALDAARDMAARLCAVPRRALAHVKRLVRTHHNREGILADERTLFCDLMVQDEAIALMAAMNAGNGDIRNPEG
ncbi:MAG: enoyl-CoA hydratase/isomerase family protein [Alteriqipengyuania sp.]